MLVDRALAVPADPHAVARRLQGRPDLAVLVSDAGTSPYGRRSFVACDADDEVVGLDPFRGARAAHVGHALAAAPWFVGALPYEARRDALERPAWRAEVDRPPPLVRDPRWYRYPAVVVIDHATAEVRVVGTSPGAVADLARLCSAGAPEPAEVSLEVETDEVEALHLARVARAIELIHAGDLYQVNLARRFLLRVRPWCGGASAVALLGALTRRAPGPFGALVPCGRDVVAVGTSPELFLDARSDDRGAGFAALVTEPIKGTRPRAADAAAEARAAEELDLDPKERAELGMIVDVERNDLSRVCARGSVTVVGAPRVVTLPTVHHRLARVGGRARAGVSRTEVLEAMLPSGSVTGAPKVRAMEIIAELEPARRGLYTGALGYAAHDGSMRLCMAIRTAVMGPDGEGEYWVGGGIVADSDPARELQETEWKAVQIRASTLPARL